VTPALDPKALGHFLAKSRDDHGLSQAALAKAAGISRPYLSQIECGERTPSDEVMNRLVVLSGASMKEMVDLLRPSISADEADALSLLLQPYDALAEVLPPEDLLALTQNLATVEQVASAVGKLPGEPMPSGPDGWLDLTKDDRRIIQRMVNRLLAGPKVKER
jgi:transcriptional regulator with XRE-family HTH domain